MLFKMFDNDDQGFVSFEKLQEGLSRLRSPSQHQAIGLSIEDWEGLTEGGKLCDASGHLRAEGFGCMLRRQLCIFSLRRAATAMQDSDPSQVSVLAMLKLILIMLSDSGESWEGTKKPQGNLEERSPLHHHVTHREIANRKDTPSAVHATASRVGGGLGQASEHLRTQEPVDGGGEGGEGGGETPEASDNAKGGLDAGADVGASVSSLTASVAAVTGSELHGESRVSSTGSQRKECVGVGEVVEDTLNGETVQGDLRADPNGHHALCGARGVSLRDGVCVCGRERGKELTREYLDEKMRDLLAVMEEERQRQSTWRDEMLARERFFALPFFALPRSLAPYLPRSPSLPSPHSTRALSCSLSLSLFSLSVFPSPLVSLSVSILPLHHPSVCLQTCLILGNLSSGTF